MTVLDLGAGLGGIAGGVLWKAATIVLLIVMLASGAAGGALWWSAASARDKALADLKTEQGVTTQLRAGVNAQNSAIQAQATLAREAEARGLAAQQQAAVAGRRFDGALQQLAGARATTCADAMPAVNKLLEQVR